MGSARLHAPAADGEAAIRAAGDAINERNPETEDEIRSAVPAARAAALALKTRSESTGWQVGRFTGLGISAFQNWLFEKNRQWHLTDGALCVLWCVEFPDARSDYYAKNHRYVAGTRRDYNRGEHHAEAPSEPCVPYGRFGRPLDEGRSQATIVRSRVNSTLRARPERPRHSTKSLASSPDAVEPQMPHRSTAPLSIAAEVAPRSLKWLLEHLETGNHPACSNCVWRPSQDRRVAFGTSCLKHGVDWRTGNSAISVQISQDPAGTTPERTGCLCAVCNSVNPTDRSAQQGISLWQAAVHRDSDHDAGATYVSGHYWTNAVMHGSNNRGQLPRARVSCAAALEAQLALLTPKVVIACGVDAATSLNELGFLARRWVDIREMLKRDAYYEQAVIAGSPTLVFVTYHTSARSVNQTVASLWSVDIDRLLDRKLAERPGADEARRFLLRYPSSTTSGRGMRVLLVHWIEIGDAIRAAHSVGDRSGGLAAADVAAFKRM